jgi:hypothetical protein
VTFGPKARRKPQVNGLGFLHQLLRKNWTRTRDENGIEWGINFKILNKRKWKIFKCMNLERWPAIVGGWTEHVVWWNACVHAWNCVILLGSMNKCNARTEMHVFILQIVWFCCVLWTNVILELKCMCSCLKLCDSTRFYEKM